LAALAGVDMEQYEAAVVDGAGRFRQLLHITLPAIRGTIVLLLILRMGSVLNTGFDQIFLMSNSVNRSVSDVFDTYVYRKGLNEGSYSFSAAVGLFKAVIGMVLVYTTNWIAKRAGESGIF
jgi:putative aldouronate transport system permease protein